MTQEEEIKDKLITFRCSESEKEEIDNFAKELDLSVAQLIRTSIEYYKNYISEKNVIIKKIIADHFNDMNSQKINDLYTVIDAFNKQYESIKKKIEVFRDKKEFDKDFIEIIEPGFTRFKQKLLTMLYYALLNQ